MRVRLCRLIFVLVALFGAAIAAAAEQVSATVLVYHRQDPGAQPDLSRVLVTPAFMRLDGGDQRGDFVLFDRRSRTVHSVVHEDGTIYDIPDRPVTVDPPVELNIETARVDGGDLPEISGRRPQHYRIDVNGSRCYDVVAVPGLLPEAVEALREFRQVLAGEHAALLSAMPADMQDPCELALHTFAPTTHLQYGLPIEEAGANGFRQSLADFKAEAAVAESLFRLPGEYRHYGSGAAD